MEITTKFYPADGYAETWANGVIISREPIVYGYNELSVNGNPVSQWKQNSNAQNGYEACDYETGAIYQNLFQMDAERLAYQIASAYAYRISTLEEFNNA